MSHPNRWDKPSGYARWGWVFAGINALLVLVNLACIAFLDGGWPNWAAAAFIAVMGVVSYRRWRDGVRSDAAHREFMRSLDRPWLS